MKIIGLTGGIGSGKSTIGKWFVEKGIPVYDSDSEAKILMDENEELKQKLTELLGEETYSEGIYNRSYVASKVFQNAELLKKLNSIVHPAVFQHFNDWVKQQKSPFLVKEAAILFESGSYKNCDKIISVVADEEHRIQRVKKRDGLPEQQILARIQNQWTDQQRIEKSDFVIHNNSDLNHLKLQFEEVYKELLKLSESS